MERGGGNHSLLDPGLLQAVSIHAVTKYTSTIIIPLGILFRKLRKDQVHFEQYYFENFETIQSAQCDSIDFTKIQFISC